jgi:hypothetical protein
VSGAAWYRVRITGDSFIGYGHPDVFTRGYPTLVAVHECEAQCWKDPRTAAEVALSGGFVPFTVEEAR